MKKELYTTIQRVIDFHTVSSEKDPEDPLLPGLLESMRKQGLLSEKPLPVPEITGQMTTDEFRQAYNEIPFNANKIIHAGTSGTDVQENCIFPEGRDVFCVQHIRRFGIPKKYSNHFFEVTYCFSGESILYYKNEEIPLSEGDICIITPDTMHLINPKADSFAFEAIIKESSFNSLFNEFLIAGSVLSEFFRNALLKQEHENYCIIHTDPSDKELHFYLKAFTAECIHDSVYANTCAISLIKLFLSRAFRKYGAGMEISSIDFENVRPDIDSILQYIRNNYRDVTLSKTAEYFHYNKSYLSRFIHNRFQRSFMEIVTKMKIDSAKEYLVNSNRKIADIALLVGYDSADHFSRTFKQHEGLSPVAFRKAHDKHR